MSKNQDLSEAGKCLIGRVDKSGIHGRGLFATENVRKGTFVCRYVGEIIDNAEANRRLEDGNPYIVSLSTRRNVDGKNRWNVARFLNHACTPNCELGVVGDEIHVTTTKAIQKGGEFTIDYGFEFDPEEFQDWPCHCGSPDCLGFLVGGDDRDKLHKHLHEEAARRRAAQNGNGSVPGR
jgi:SET domain-containing protein